MPAPELGTGGDSESWLASRLPGTAAWYGRATCQWWAMTGGALITAPTARELARLLGVAPPRSG